MKCYLLKKIIILILVFTTSILSGKKLYAENKRLSVLYFDNLKGREEDKYFAKAFAQMLTVDLSKIKGLNLIEREEMQKILNEYAIEVYKTAELLYPNSPYLQSIATMTTMFPH